MPAGYTLIPGGFEVATPTLIDSRMYFDTIFERDNLDTDVITAGIFTFIGENKRAYISDIIDGVLQWLPLTGYSFSTEIELEADAETTIDETVHMVPMIPLVIITRTITIDGIQHYEPIECSWTFDQQGDFHITSSKHVIANINMIHNG